MLLHRQGSPRGETIKYAVRYKGGRKEFNSVATALEFAKASREEENGWAEVAKVTTKIIERKR